ncbi:MAG: dTDP-4-dehydrorhamnose 3,5-epimerase, partial [Anaerolineae bacterium]|nr:dTDP-4-dehydrorhamnose 3,5-epimerase [Anaerolineae bacterium]
MGFQRIPLPLDGACLIAPTVYRDPRGFFMESYSRRAFAEIGIPIEFVQDNHSRSVKGVVRGLHFQDARAPQAKLVRCTVGQIWDVIVDLRLGSPTFGRWTAVELSAENCLMLFVPAGFAHGFAALSDIAELQYKCDAYYTPQAERAIRWDDPDLAISWPVSHPLLSAKDAAAPSF